MMRSITQLTRLLLYLWIKHTRLLEIQYSASLWLLLLSGLRYFISPQQLRDDKRIHIKMLILSVCRAASQFCVCTVLVQTDLCKMYEQ